MIEILSFILGGIFLGLIGALLGKSRDRIGEGFFWGFVLGPIGWVIVLLRADLRPKCPACLGVIIKDAGRCKNCGVELEWVALDSGHSDTQLYVKKIFVPRVRQVNRPIPKASHPVARAR